MSFYKIEDYDAYIGQNGLMTLEQVEAATGIDKEKIQLAIARNKLRKNACYSVSDTKLVIVLDVAGGEVKLAGGE